MMPVVHRTNDIDTLPVPMQYQVMLTRILHSFGTLPALASSRETISGTVRFNRTCNPCLVRSRVQASLGSLSQPER